MDVRYTSNGGKYTNYLRQAINDLGYVDREINFSYLFLDMKPECNSLVMPDGSVHYKLKDIKAFMKRSEFKKRKRK